MNNFDPTQQYHNFNRHGQKLSFPSLTLKLSQVQAKSTNQQNMVDLAEVLL